MPLIPGMPGHVGPYWPMDRNRWVSGTFLSDGGWTAEDGPRKKVVRQGLAGGVLLFIPEGGHRLDLSGAPGPGSACEGSQDDEDHCCDEPDNGLVGIARLPMGR